MKENSTPVNSKVKTSTSTSNPISISTRVLLLLLQDDDEVVDEKEQEKMIKISLHLVLKTKIMKKNENLFHLYSVLFYNMVKKRKQKN